MGDLKTKQKAPEDALDRQQGGAGGELDDALARLAHHRLGQKRPRLNVYLPLLHALLNYLAVSASFSAAYVFDAAGWMGEIRRFDHGRPVGPYLLLSAALGLGTVALGAMSGAYGRYDTIMNVGSKTKLLRGYLATMVLVFVVDLFGRLEISRLIYAMGAVMAVPALMLSSNVHVRVARWCRSRGVGVRRAAVLGVNYLGRMLARKLHQQPGAGYVLVGFIADSLDGERPVTEPPVVSGGVSLPVLGYVASIDEVLVARDIQDVFVARTELSNEAVLELLAWQERTQVAIHFVPPASLVALELAASENLDGLPLIRLNAAARSRLQGAVKRAFDIVVALCLIVLTLPVMLLLTVLTKLSSRGPVIFRQERIGGPGHPFTIFKFRTMSADSEPYAETPRAPDDPRVTRLGRVLRYLDLDELPQLFNVLIGHMAIVGPRPEMPQIVEQYSEVQRLRLSLKPGMTGLWQLSPDRHMPIHENLDYDLYYIENKSLLLDVVIVLDTAFYLIRKLVPLMRGRWLTDAVQSAGNGGGEGSATGAGCGT